MMEGGIKIQCFADIPSALGWIHHSIFNLIRGNAHDEVEKSLARDMMEFKYSFIYQHIKGNHNDVLDSLSRDGNISPPKITHLLYKLIQT